MSGRATIVLFAWLVGCGAPTPTPTLHPLPDGTGTGLVARVEHVTDGDTITLAFPGQPAERVRLLGIDTPETVKPGAPVECYGPEATARMKALLPLGTEVVVQRDHEPRDRFGRLLVYVWRRSDGLFVNRDLLESGHATVLSFAPNTTHRVALSQAEQAARRQHLGLWGACDPPTGR